MNTIPKIDFSRVQATRPNLEAENAALRARIAELEAGKAKAMGFKVTKKGGLSVYGLGRFPVTLYQSQWVKLLDKAEDIRAFMKANADKLATKE